MSILRSLVTVALVFTLGAASFAQSTTPNTTTTPTPTPARQHGGGGGKMRQMMGQLNLTADQKAQIKEIRKNGSKGKERMQAIMAVLTPEQRQKFMALRGHGGGHNHGGSTTSSPSTTTPSSTTPSSSSPSSTSPTTITL